MDADRTSNLVDFEKKERDILAFEEEYTKKEKTLKDLLQKCKELDQKVKVYEEKSSQDEVVATQLSELRVKIEQYEKSNQELTETNARLQMALQNVQDDGVKIEDELNALKSATGDINEIKSKMKMLEETVIAQQKELVEKDKILKGRIAEGAESKIAARSIQRFIVGKAETISEFNRLLENVKFRLFLVFPAIEDLLDLNLTVFSKLEGKVEIRIATAIDRNNDAHLKIIRSYPNVEFRHFKNKDRYGLESDSEEICFVAQSENKDLIGLSSSDSKINDLFLKLMTEAWLKAEKITL
jgi:DNA repair exonuclease SbcCD ATPase subunit